MTEIFISYSRRDKEFVKSLHEAFTQLNRDVWVDWQDIPLTADWKQEIYTGIEGTNNFVDRFLPKLFVAVWCLL